MLVDNDSLVDELSRVLRKRRLAAHLGHAQKFLGTSQATMQPIDKSTITRSTDISYRRGRGLSCSIGNGPSKSIGVRLCLA